MPGVSLLIIVLVVLLFAVAGGIIGLVIYATKIEKELTHQKESHRALEAQLTQTKQELATQQDHEKLASTSSPQTDQLLSHSEAGVIVIDKAGNIVLFNQFAETFTGVTTEVVRQKPYGGIVVVTRENGDMDDTPIKAALLGAKAAFPPGTHLMTRSGAKPVVGSVTPVMTAQGPDGAIISFAEATALFDEYKKQVGMLKTATTDLTQTKQELTLLKQTDELSRLLFNDIDTGIAVLDLAGNIILFNPYAERFTGLFRDNVIGKPYHQTLYFTNQKGDQDNTAVQAALSGKSATLESWTFLTSRNGKSPVTGTVKPITGPAGPAGVVVAFRDATRQLQEEQDEKAFFSAAAHDLRTPLTTIRAVMELLLTTIEDTPKEKAKDMLTNANESVLHLIAIVNDLLSVSRIETGRMEVKKEVFAITELTDEVVSHHQVLTKEKKLYLNHPPPDVAIPKVLGDRNKAQEILNNLLSNSIKYTHQGGITITHTMENLRVATLITDTGIGISPDNYRLLFKKFQQVGTARNQPLTKSTGLGLYIARRFAQLMGGDLVLVHSEPGQGTTFKFWLPIAPQA